MRQIIKKISFWLAILVFLETVNATTVFHFLGHKQNLSLNSDRHNLIALNKSSPPFCTFNNQLPNVVSSDCKINKASTNIYLSYQKNKSI